MGMEEFWNWAPDTNTYWAVATHLLDHHDNGQWALFRVGPGFGAILVGIRLLFGDNPIFAICFSMLMGILAPVAVYLLADILLGRRYLSLLAGVMAAVSFTSISLSTHILTDQTYFTIQCLSLAALAFGLKRGGVRWFVLAGLGTGIAMLVRPTGQFWPLIFLILPLLIPLPEKYKSRRRFWLQASLAGAVSLVIALSWMTRNYAVEGVFTFGSNGVFTVRDCLWAQVESRRTGTHIYDFRARWIKEDGDRGPDLGEAYRLASKRINAAFREYPTEFAVAYWDNLIDNVLASNGYAERQLPLGVETIKTYNRAFSDWIGWLLFGLTVLGLFVLARWKEWTTLLLLAVTYFHFTLLLGFSFWQGSRLHYPAEMAGNILVSVALVQLVQGIVWLTRRLKAGRATA